MGVLLAFVKDAFEARCTALEHLGYAETCPSDIVAVKSDCRRPIHNDFNEWLAECIPPRQQTKRLDGHGVTHMKLLQTTWPWNRTNAAGRPESKSFSCS